MISGLGDLGFSLSLSAVGSAIGSGIAGMAAIGAWKKCYLQNKLAPFLLIAFVGAPLSQTIYGMILRNAILAANWPEGTGLSAILFGAVAGIGMGVSAMMQGKAGASAADAMAETGKGFTNYIMVLGIAETVALFVMAFSFGALPK